MSRAIGLFFVGAMGCLAGCAADSTPSDGASAEAVSGGAHKITKFTCTATSASEAHLRGSRIDIGIDTTVAGVPTGNLITGFDATLNASTGVGFGVSHVRDTTASGHSVSEYKIDFGADSILQGATGGTVGMRPGS
jgi:hypothetical protein